MIEIQRQSIFFLKNNSEFQGKIKGIARNTICYLGHSSFLSETIVCFLFYFGIKNKTNTYISHNKSYMSSYEYELIVV